jgi:multidrug efflux pump subunit AcrA (membrane-fusion protein)
MRRSTLLLNSVLGVGVIALGAGGWFVLRDEGTSSTTTRTTTTVRRGSVSSAVSASGNLLSRTQFDVSFDSAVSSNLVTEILVKVGDKVTKGQPLARVDATTVTNTFAAAQAAYDSALASLDKLKTGLTPQERAQNQASLAQSAASVRSAETSLANARASAGQNAVGYDNAVSQAETSLANARAQADRDLATSQLAVDQAQAAWNTTKTTWDTAKATRDADKAAYDAAAADVAKFEAAVAYCTTNPGAPTAPDGTACPANAALTTAQTTLTTRNTALNGPNGSQAGFDKADATLTQATNSSNNANNGFANTQLKAKQSIDGASNSLTNARNSRDAGQLRDAQSIVSAQRQLESAQLSYNSALAGNAVKERPPTEAELAQSNSQVINARNSLATAQKNLNAATLVAPIEGTIAVLNGKVGVAPGSAGNNANANAASASGSASTTAFLTITDPNGFEVRAGFSEADALKVKVGQTATVSLDAVSGSRFGARVNRIDGASTLVSNVVTYYVYLTITDVPAANPPRPGMTATASVTVEEATDVLVLPSSAVTARGTTATVAVQTVPGDPTKTEDRQITIGLRGDNGLEISAGLAEGDVVVVTRTAISAAGAGAATQSGTLTGGQTAIPGAGGGTGGTGNRVRGG